MKYNRILVKLSGEAISSKESDSIFSKETLEKICKELIRTANAGCQIGVVIGAGNIWRGKNNIGFTAPEADSMGMLATVMNSIALRSTLERLGQKTRLFTSVTMPTIAETFHSDIAIKALENDEIVIIAGGTGNPFFTTDTAAVLRALELNAQVTLMAKNIDAIYNRDPKKESKEPLIRYSEMNFDHVLGQGLKAIDLTAAALCKEKGMDVAVFDLNGDVSIYEVAEGKVPGTFISNSIIDLKSDII